MQLSVKVTPGTMMGYASINVTGNDETEDVPNVISTPPPLFPSMDQTGDADANGTNTTHDTSGTANTDSASTTASQASNRF